MYKSIKDINISEFKDDKLDYYYINNQQLANSTKCLVQQMHVIIGGVNSKAVNMKFPIRIKLNNESCQFMSYELRVLSNAYTKRESKFDDWEYFQQNIFYNDYEQLLTSS